MDMIIDLHSHILPGIDDGSRSVEESVAMLQMEAEQGIRHVVATPHFYGHLDTPEHFLEKRNRAEESLREALEKYPDLPQIHVGAEVHYFRGISTSEASMGLTIGGNSCILIEMPYVKWSDFMYRELEAIYTRFGLTPIIAHIDRYISPFRAKQVLERLADLPVLVQANASFFLNAATANMALRMLKRDQIHLLGSDCHNLTERKPNLGLAIERIQKRSGTELLERICRCQTELLEMEL